ncbi:hypothetical protein T484DRAFT_1927604 [Baffinella frigidus]|nr:hypothetical protein T484DRAFT_1927604 [Cryptophyta sp. CCMP2293]
MSPERPAVPEGASRPEDEGGGAAPGLRPGGEVRLTPWAIVAVPSRASAKILRISAALSSAGARTTCSSFPFIICLISDTRIAAVRVTAEPRGSVCWPDPTGGERAGGGGTLDNPAAPVSRLPLFPRFEGASWRSARSCALSSAYPLAR